MGDHISDDLKFFVRQQSGNRCGYCLSHQQYVYGTLEIEHIIPKSLGGSSSEENLWMACRLCNSYKADKTHNTDPVTNETVALFNPRQNKWREHFKWSDSGTHILGITLCGRATVEALKLNNVFAVTVRRAWVSVGWHPPQS